MFGVVRQVAGQTKGEFENSISNLQFPKEMMHYKSSQKKENYPQLKKSRFFGLN